MTLHHIELQCADCTKFGSNVGFVRNSYPPTDAPVRVGGAGHAIYRIIKHSNNSVAPNSSALMLIFQFEWPINWSDKSNKLPFGMVFFKNLFRCPKYKTKEIVDVQ
jgi:hypothetical protein